MTIEGENIVRFNEMKLVIIFCLHSKQISVELRELEDQ